MTGFSGISLKNKIQEVLDTCQKCTATKMVMSGKSPLTKSQLLERGPDDFIWSCLEQDVMQFLILDEAGVFFLTGSKSCPGMV